MAVLHLTKDNFNETLNTDVPVLVDFFAQWCGPCKMLGPVIEEVGKEIGNKGVIAKIDVDKQQDLAAQYGVASIPTIVVFKNGKEVDRSVGFIDKSKIVSLIEKHA
ncbi:thioredoxin [Treponema phagedenis]|uniref:Thioredoxin n=1 Tax=Treponema phagedenis TaxID=162 RepID=A0A0B7GX02_TREPH|nr:thioredoxin [Treponema phagedenis]EFW37409.1 thioredoxin [Treponema phagedenis F0421]NVP23667.1 thioredoxin [Treponema phagedenis]QEJ94500.1 thioredoxin [Treponema phagedenis]QEJ98791.1 thioredoxin [Treponema phagedenis]QEK01618.1 thioredoxin [Treponema phagedenis]